MPTNNLHKFTLEITADQYAWIKEHPEIDVAMLFRQTILNQMLKHKPKDKNARKTLEQA